MANPKKDDTPILSNLQVAFGRRKWSPESIRQSSHESVWIPMSDVVRKPYLTCSGSPTTRILAVLYDSNSPTHAVSWMRIADLDIVPYTPLRPLPAEGPRRYRLDLFLAPSSVDSSRLHQYAEKLMARWSEGEDQFHRTAPWLQDWISAAHQGRYPWKPWLPPLRWTTSPTSAVSRGGNSSRRAGVLQSPSEEQRFPHTTHLSLSDKHRIHCMRDAEKEEFALILARSKLKRASIGGSVATAKSLYSQILSELVQY